MRGRDRYSVSLSLRALVVLLSLCAALAVDFMPAHVAAVDSSPPSLHGMNMDGGNATATAPRHELALAREAAVGGRSHASGRGAVPAALYVGGLYDDDVPGAPSGPTWCALLPSATASAPARDGRERPPESLSALAGYVPLRC